VDIVPTILEACSLPAPKMVNGIEQQPMNGVSMMYSFADAGAPSTEKYSILRCLAVELFIPMAGRR